MTKIIIDSGSDHNQWFEENYNPGFLPLSIIINNEPYLDREEITQQELLTAMKEGVMPSTSQPSPGQVQKILEENYKKDKKLLFISIWKNISGTFQTIRNAIDEFKDEHPDFQAEIVDCKSGSVASTLIAIQALEMEKAGYSFKEIYEQAKWNADHISIYLAADDLKWLVKGGRLSKTAGFIGSALNVKPLIAVNEEELYSKEVVRGNKRVYKKIVEKIKNETNDFTDQLYLISHVGEEDNARKVQSLIEKEIPDAKTMVFEISAVLAAHIGIGGVAVAGLTKKPKTYIMPSF